MRSFTLSSPSDSIDWNTGTPDANGAYWIATDLLGWDGSDVSLQLANRLGVPGQYTQSGEPLGRQLSVKSSLLIAPSEAARIASRDRLQALLLTIASSDTPGTLLVHDPTAAPGVFLDRSCRPFTSQRPQMIDHPPARGGIGPIGGSPIHMPTAWPSAIDWTVTAPDPLRYGVLDSHAFVDGVAFTVTNAGTAPTVPSITLNAPGAHIGLTHTDLGRTVTFDSGAMPGTLNVLLDTRDVLDGGGADRYDVVSSNPLQWWTLLPGVNHLTISGASGTIFWQPAWW